VTCSDAAEQTDQSSRLDVLCDRNVLIKSKIRGNTSSLKNVPENQLAIKAVLSPEVTGRRP